MFATLAYAQNGAAAQPSFIQSMIPLILMIAIFYFLLIRPQMKKTKEHRAMLEALQVGDKVVTSGGVHGELKAITPEVVTLQLDDKVKVKVDRAAIARKITAAPTA
ncbi:MAG: preprotein translocase subunit YajC [bacterium]|nr:preprotein translocase subunit YajC [bacterium]